MEEGAKIIKAMIADLTLDGFTWSFQPGWSKIVQGEATHIGRPAAFDLVPPHMVLNGDPTRLFLCFEPSQDDDIRYEPLEKDSGLFRTFADTEPTPNGVEIFASSYGFLGLTRYEVRPDEAYATPQDHDAVGEHLDDWQLEIKWMRTAIELARAASSGSTREIQRVLRIHGTAATLTDRDGTKLPLKLQTELPDDPVLASKQVLAKVASERLQGSMQTSLVTQEGSISARSRPTSLIAALWLQFALNIDDPNSYRKCDQCKRWFEVTPSVNRKDRKYCSNACRTKAYRRRKKTDEPMSPDAKKKFASIKQGLDLSMEKLRKEAGADPETVRKSIEEEEGGSR